MGKRKRDPNRSHRAYGDTRNTTQQGLGYTHQQARRVALAAMVDGMPCPICGVPMHKTQALDYDHVIPRALGGIGGEGRLTHSTCNRSSGATLGNRMRGAKKGRRPQRQKPRYPSW